MATRNLPLTDAGAARAAFVIRRTASGVVITVTIATNEGVSISHDLTDSEIAAALTAPERTNLRTYLQQLYAAALTAEGFA